MKKFLFLLLLTPILGAAQFDTTKFYRSPNVGEIFRRAKINALMLPGDTTTNKVGIAQIGGVLYSFGSGKWNAIVGADTTILASKAFTNATYALRNRAIVAGYGLAGGGDLSADRSFIVDSTVIASKSFVNNYLPLTGGTLTGALINSYASTASTPASRLSGSWVTGGTGTTTKPHFLIEPSGATSTGWNTNGTGIGVNAASGFTGNLIDLHINGASQFRVASNAVVTSGQFTAGTTISSGGAMISGGNYNLPNANKVNWGGGYTFIEGADSYFRVQVNGVERWRILSNGKTSQPTTANSPKGTATLVNGVVTISNTLATTGCFIQVNYSTGTALTGTSSILTVSSIVAATSFTVTAYTPGAATTNTSDNNVIEYTISN